LGRSDLCRVQNIFVEAKQSIINVPQTISDKGYALSVDDFNEAFVGEFSSRKDLNECKSLEVIHLQIRDFSVFENNISFNLNLKASSGPWVEHHLRGNLYVDDSPVRSVLGNLSDTTGFYEILKFKIVTSLNNDNMLFNSKLQSKPYLSLILQDGSGKLFFFEIDIPKIFSQLDNIILPMAPHDLMGKNDLWFTPIVDLTKGTFTEDEVTLEMWPELGIFPEMTRGLGSFTLWVNPTTYTCNLIIGGELTVYKSLPYLSMKHVNVTSQDSTWIAAFKISESTTFNNGKTYYGQNVFYYGDLKLAFGAGARSTIIRTYQQGRMIDSKTGSGSTKASGTIAIFALDRVVSLIPAAPNISDIIELFDKLNSSSSNVTLGSQGVSLSNKLVTHAGELLSNYTFSKYTDWNGSDTGDYFTFQAVLQYESTLSTSISTAGALRFETTARTSAGVQANIKQNITLNYTASR